MKDKTRKDLDAFEASIKQYLDERAEKDGLFAVRYANEKKSVSECCRFIYTVVRKAGRVAWTDDEIFGMAVHYYDEEDPGEIGKVKPGKVMVPADYFTEEEMDELREEARREYKEAVRKEYERKAEKMRQKKVARKVAEAEGEEVLTLF